MRRAEHGAARGTGERGARRRKGKGKGKGKGKVGGDIGIPTPDVTGLKPISVLGRGPVTG